VIVIAGPTNFSRKYHKQEEPLPESGSTRVESLPAQENEAFGGPKT